MKDEWLWAAISDDNLVAGLLLRLKDSSPLPSLTNPLPPSWGLRQPRSSSEKRRETRRSPTTPLSWTGDASPSEGFEESSSLRLLPSDRFRSKIFASTETPTTTSKRPRRKKTFAELKEEESSLLKERTYLKKELATLRLTLKEQRSINDNLKRMKLNLHAECGVKSEANSVDEQDTNHNRISEAASSSTSKQGQTEDSLPPQNSIFVLPDLNMVPDEAFTLGLS